MSQDLLARIFVASPKDRVSIGEIMKHEWFLHNLPTELQNNNAKAGKDDGKNSQNKEQIEAIIDEARKNLQPDTDLSVDDIDDMDMDDLVGSGEIGSGDYGM